MFEYRISFVKCQKKETVIPFLPFELFLKIFSCYSWVLYFWKRKIIIKKTNLLRVSFFEKKTISQTSREFNINCFSNTRITMTKIIYR